MSPWETICIVLIACTMGWQIEKLDPKPYPLGNGDTLMVRTKGYGFCPKYCGVDHFHIGHEKGYECKDIICNHIIYDDRLKQNDNIYMDGAY